MIKKKVFNKTDDLQNPSLDSDQADKSCDGEEEGFTFVKQYFSEDEWASHSQLEKKRFKNIYDTWKRMEQKGESIATCTSVTN